MVENNIYQCFTSFSVWKHCVKFGGRYIYTFVKLLCFGYFVFLFASFLKIKSLRYFGWHTLIMHVMWFWFITSVPLNWKVALDARINLACSWCLPDFHKAKLLLFGAVQAWSELPHLLCRPIHHTWETWLVKFRLCTHYFSCKNNALFSSSDLHESEKIPLPFTGLVCVIIHPPCWFL